MAHSRSRRQPQNQQGGGRGRGRGGGEPATDPRGVGAGVLKPQKAKNKGRGGGGARRQAGRGARTANSVPQAVDIVKEDFIFRHQEVEKAHGDAIMAIVLASDADGREVVYTAARDKLLKRWKAAVNATGRLELQPDLEVGLGEIAWCLISAGDWLFCGLGNGAIRGYCRSGGDATLHGTQGHTKRVACLLTHQHVLLSGSLDGSVRCWLMDPATQRFACTHSVTEGVPGGVTCMTVLDERLWVGTASGVAVVDLATLQVVQQVGPRKLVAGMLQFTGHMIVVYAEGAVCIFTTAGEQSHSQGPLPAGAALCIAGLESGPRVLCGHSKGQVSTIELPAFKLRSCWQSFDRCKVHSIACAGREGIFLVGGENGALQLWQRDGVAAAASGG